VKLLPLAVVGHRKLGIDHAAISPGKVRPHT
jgi:hypothetical protein